MLNITRIGLAAALVVGSFSLAMAQDVEPAPLTTQRNYGGPSVRDFQRFEHRNVAPNEEYNYYHNTSPEQPWSNSMDPGNTSGGN